MRQIGRGVDGVTRGHVIATWVLITLFASSAAVLTRYAEVPAASIGFWRVFGAGVVLAPWWWRERRRTGRLPLVTKGALLSGMALGVHFATWCWALQHTSVANATLFIGLQPLIVPMIARWLIGERLNRWEVVGSVLALVGSLWILGNQVLLGEEDLLGSLVAIFSAIWCSLYFVLGRKYRGSQHVILFSVPVYMVAAIVQASFACLFNGGVRVGGGWTPLALLGLIMVPTVGGHTLAMYLLRYAKAQTLSLSVPAQFSLAGLAGWALFKEVPSEWFYVGALLVLGGVIVGVVFGGDGDSRGANEGVR
ncbi:MAG: DMT family transporter [bacterium]|nr:DMT family transporter [bacterium]